MAPTIRPARVGARGIDCITKLTPELLDEIDALPPERTIEFFLRYVGHPKLSLDAEETSLILSRGKAIMPVGWSRREGWTPTPQNGEDDGRIFVESSRECGILDGVSCWCDLEGINGTNQQTDDYARAWCGPTDRFGIPSGYIGSGVPLNETQLYYLPFRGYWHSCSEVANVARVGYQMIQLFPPDILLVPGLPVDLNFVQADKRNRVPMWMIAA